MIYTEQEIEEAFQWWQETEYLYLSGAFAYQDFGNWYVDAYDNHDCERMFIAKFSQNGSITFEEV